ncbi:MAG: hypothetical protein UV76_C0011G0022 [Candidatus Nomurabacteria bacterium GW2011_GWA2_43_15]|uniref:AI-2E family transporter n=2 Tax=Candidatus Nomuraibacteriota TaxID=1752729 RepID=A0A0G1DRS4_9BACT|nr:MAG: hypothetical protein UV76_C0011G0022 [Candidatus Nomurabacteria bacterium GW2011_GWA2_43_15]KKT19062.1 MAG: hypothetical protein UW02_C0016G0036 [Candidatus Nomurabacteria bacterium GW2011_GWB1_43_7]
MQPKIIEKYFFFGLLAATFIFAFFIFRPFWIVLVLGVSFSILLYPIHSWFSNRKLPNWLSSFLTILLFIIVLCGPLLAIGVMVFNQSENVYWTVAQKGGTGEFIRSIDSTMNKILPAGITFDTNEKVSNFISYVSSNIASIFSSAVSAFFSFILMLFIMFYFLKDGERWRKAVVSLSPLSDKDDEKIISKLALAVNAVMKGYLFIALVQGILMGVGLWIFGVPNPALWGVVAAVASLIPTFGTAFVSVPAIIFLFMTGNTVYAVGLLIWSVVMVGTIDNLLTPLVVGGKTNISPLLVLFSVLGGISFLGPVGILLGPLTVSLLYTLISIYRDEFKQSTTL